MMNEQTIATNVEAPTLKKSLLNTLMQRKRNNQKGLALVDLILWGVGILAVISIIVTMYPKAMHQINMTRLDTDMTEIQKAARNWKGLRTNYTSVDIATLCTSNYLSDSLCGDSDDATSANPWGGDYTVAVDTNKSRISVTVTTIDANYGQQVVDHVAPRTADECASSDSCATASLSGTTATFILN